STRTIDLRLGLFLAATQQAPSPSAIETAENHSCVGATKTKGIGHNCVDGLFLGPVGNQVYRGFHGRIVEVDRGRHDLVANGENCEHRLYRACRAEKMAYGG